MNQSPGRDRFDEAVAAHEAGDLEAAERLYRELLDEDQDDAVVLELLGSALVAGGRNREALTHLARSISLDAGSPTAHLAHADALTACGDARGAEKSLNACLAIDGAMRPAIMRLGTMLAEQGRLEEAGRLADRLRAIEPDAPELRVTEMAIESARNQPSVVLDLAARLPPGLLADASIIPFVILALAGLGRHAEAEQLLERVPAQIAISSEARVFSMLASRDRFDEAAAWWDLRGGAESTSNAAAAIAISALRTSDPSRAERLQREIARKRFGLAAPDVVAGMTAHAAGDHRAAAEHLGRAVALRADDAALIATCASALNATGRAAEAATMLELARARHPAHVPILVESARASLSLHRYEEAERLFLESHGHDPAAIGPMRGLVEVALLAGRYRDSLVWCDRIRGLACDEVSEVCASEALAGSLRQHEALARIDAFPDRGFDLQRQSLYLSNFVDSLPETEIFRRHADFGASIAGADPARDEAQRRDALRQVLGQPRRIRIGFLSPDFRRHSVWYFIEPLLGSLDRDRFEPIGISDTILADSITARIRACCDGWIDVAGTRSESFRDLVRSLDLDILVELTGHTAGSRLPELARRLAPVQMSWLGYPNTTGVGAIDFRLVDAWTDPQGSEHLATETLLRLPRCFLCHLRPPELPSPRGLPREGGSVFGSFNNLAKITDTTIRAWSAVLRADPDSTLLIKSKSFRDPDTLDRLRERFRSTGVAWNRIVVRPWARGALEHLSTYREVDVALDTFPYQGTTTTCEALSMGVPVVSLGGDGHRSRVGTSLLHAIGRSEWAAASESEFVAAALAATELRAKPGRDLLEGTPLRDPPGFARDFAAALAAASIARDVTVDRDG